MPNLQVTQVTGFEELRKQIKRLEDSVKRKEVNKILRAGSKRVVVAYSNALPKGTRSRNRITNSDTFNYAPGNLRRSVKITTVPGRYTGGNPQIVIRPESPKGKLKDKRGNTRADGYYRFMLVPKGTRLRGRGKGSRTGLNSVVKRYRDLALGIVPSVMQGNTKETAKYLQKQIDRLSRR